MNCINSIILLNVKPIQKGDALFKRGDELKLLYSIRSGTINSYSFIEEGDEQITSFYLAGDFVGFNAIINNKCLIFAQSIENFNNL